jgi:hypothetical protein
MIAELSEGSRTIDRTLPHLHAVEAVETGPDKTELQLRALAGNLCDQSLHAMQVNATGESQMIDPLAIYRELKFQLIGDVRPLARLNLHYPPGVERQSRRGRRVYGVECAVRVDPSSGDILVIRKDDIPDSADTTDWLVVRGNLSTGDFNQHGVVIVGVQHGETGDTVSLQVDPVAHPSNAYRGYTTINVQLSPDYHAVGDIDASRADYYGRGTSIEPHRIAEGNFSTDIYTLHEMLREALEERGMPDTLLDHAPDPVIALGQYAVTN